MDQLRKRKDGTYQPCVLLFKGKGVISGSIRWQTRSIYSHAAILLPDGKIIESWQGDGVRIKELKNWDNIDAFYVKGMSDEQWDKAIWFAKKQIGKKYDYIAILRFITRTKHPDNQTWFCSELVFAALLYAGVQLLKRIAASNVSPALLGLSSLLDFDQYPEASFG